MSELLIDRSWADDMPNQPKPKYARGRRICIFCKGTSGARISKEHVFATWLKEFFPRNENTTHDKISVDWRDEVGSHEAVETRTKKQGHVGSKKIRVLCERCNNVTFSGLEERAKDTLRPLIVGRRANILPGGQTLLATWGAKNVMVAENLKPVAQGIAQADRTWLLEHMAPPPKGWFVWIGAYNGIKWRDLAMFQTRVGLSATPVARPSDAPHYAEATTFGIGRILFCVVNSSSPFVNRFIGAEADGFLQIWPSQNRSILWPPLTILGDDEADSIANFFRNVGIFDQSFDPGANWTFAL